MYEPKKPRTFLVTGQKPSRSHTSLTPVLELRPAPVTTPSWTRALHSSTVSEVTPLQTQQGARLVETANEQPPHQQRSLQQCDTLRNVLTHTYRVSLNRSLKLIYLQK